ncbi:MAG: phosphoglycerate dehydrogenase [Dehalococcoidales bacterium]|nr:phosphoglycerate dehydrogenase [Dehalococcoidales bacterium]
MKFKVLALDHISEEGISILRKYAQIDNKPPMKPEELVKVIGDYDALLVRSQTKVTADAIKAGKKLQIIARAGVGIDNVDVEAATRAGVTVVNAPTGNTISAAEHSVALMLALARYIPPANTSLKAGQWRRNEFVGTELRGKTLGLIGLGNVGSAVARRAQGFEMKVIGYDPLVSADFAKKLNVEIVPFEQVLKDADFISLHIPLNEKTKNIIGAKQLAMLKPTARIINCARGGLIDEEALLQALKEKKIGGIAIDVFTKEPCTESPFFGFENVIVTPHLGASTAEAQVTAARDVAEQIADVFQGKAARYALNAPFIADETMSVLGPFVDTAITVGKLVYRLAEGQADTIRINYEGEIANYDTSALKLTVLRGLLEGTGEEHINLVNAAMFAAQRGLKIAEEKNAACQNYASLITVAITTSTGTTTVAGTVMHGQTHIVRVNDYWLDIVPSGGYFLFSDHRDRPGLIGAVGKITGDADVNISSMHLGRLESRGPALLVLALDEPLPEESIKKILALKDVHSAKLVKL